MNPAKVTRLHDKQDVVMGELIPQRPAHKDEWAGPIIVLVVLVMLAVGISKIIDIARVAW